MKLIQTLGEFLKFDCEIGENWQRQNGQKIGSSKK